MVKITTPPSLDIIKGMKGKIDYVQRRGYCYARKWPVTPRSHLTPATLSAAQIFGEILAGYRNLAPAILADFQEMAEGTPNTPRDIYVRAVLGWLHIGSVVILLTIEIQDEGSKVTDASIVNFEGPGVEATEEAPGKAKVTIPGPPTPTIEVQDEDVKVTDATILNFEGAGVSVAEEAPGKATATIPGPTLPTGVIVSRSTNQSIPNITTTPITFTTEARDDFDGWDPASPTKITVPASGWYSLATHVKWADASGGKRVLDIRINGTDYIDSIGTDAPAACPGPDLSVSLPYYLNAGDYIEATVWQNRGAPTNISAAQLYALKLF